MATTSFKRPAAPQTPFSKQSSHLNDPVPSSSPAFATPAHPLRPRPANAPRPAILPQTTAAQQGDQPSSPTGADELRRPTVPPILPILLPPQTLRPIAFRTFTKKHNLTLTSSALAALAAFVGKHCGSKWREDGLAENVLEEIARSWKKADGKVIVDADGDRLKTILKTLESCMVGGKILSTSRAGLSRQGSLVSLTSDGSSRMGVTREDSFGMSGLEVTDEPSPDDDEDLSGGTRRWMQVVNAFDQPRLIFNPSRKHFEKSKLQPSFFPSPAQKTELFQQRFHLVNQRLLRNEAFQESVISRTGSELNQQSWKLTPIANLRGRNGTGHLLLGLLSVTPSGTLAINDLTGSIHLDLEQAAPIDELETWVCPGMILLIDGIYEEEYGAPGGSLGTSNGIGGTIAGRFIAFSVGAPRCETRAASLGLSSLDSGTIGGGFGWVDFLGVGSERALGSRMRRIEQHVIQHQRHSLSDENGSKLVMLGEVHLDQPRTLSTLRRVLESYTEAPPAGFVLLGSFISNAALASPSSHSSDVNETSSIAYKEHFDALASLLSDFPTLLRNCSFIFVPGDNDPWPSAFAAGGATAVPRHPVPEMFTTRVRRAIAQANSNSDSSAKGNRPPGEVIWTTNPSRITLFGPRHEIVLMRDDLSGRLRRSAIPLRRQQQQHQPQGAEPSKAQDVEMSDPAAPQTEQPTETESTLDHNTLHARRLTKTILDQSHLSPFPLSTRPVHWSYGHALSLYPLPSALVLCDSEAEAFAVVYQDCSVVNPGCLVGSWGGKKGGARWVEFDVAANRGVVREMLL